MHLPPRPPPPPPPKQQQSIGILRKKWYSIRMLSFLQYIICDSFPSSVLFSKQEYIQSF
jgi:hypothetical protein